MRVGLLDIINGRDQIVTFLSDQEPAILNADLVALLRVAKEWRSNEAVLHVDESGTLYRFMLFASWKLDRPTKFVLSGTLKSRKLSIDPAIAEMELEELRKLDAHTSQWASAAVLLGNNEQPLEPMPYHMAMSYEALNHWQERIAAGLDWIPRKDSTIERQAQAYATFVESGVMNFTPLQSEDYCFARAFDLLTPEQGEKLWPSLRQHESDRIAAMEEMLTKLVVDSRDHRVVQAIAMIKGGAVKFTDPDAVNKTWPQFWDFLRAFD